MCYISIRRYSISNRFVVHRRFTMKTLKNVAREIEKVFAEVALAEGEIFPEPVKSIKAAEKMFECSFVDVAFAEAGAFTETACVFGHH